MPSVEQCETAQAGIAALSNTLEIFDKFKPLQDEKDSDSEESFHLPMLYDDEVENKSVTSNGKDIDSIGQNEETEDDILNKFDTFNNGTPDHLDSRTEDKILNDLDETTDKEKVQKAEEDVNDKTKDDNELNEVNKDSNANTEQTTNSEKNSGDGVAKIDVKIKLTAFEKYEESSSDGEFMSKYELENIDKIVESMEIDDEDVMSKRKSVAEKNVKSVEVDAMEVENNENPVFQDKIPNSTSNIKVSEDVEDMEVAGEEDTTKDGLSEILLPQNISKEDTIAEEDPPDEVVEDGTEENMDDNNLENIDQDTEIDNQKDSAESMDCESSENIDKNIKIDNQMDSVEIEAGVNEREDVDSIKDNQEDTDEVQGEKLFDGDSGMFQKPKENLNQESVTENCADEENKEESETVEKNEMRDEDACIEDVDVENSNADVEKIVEEADSSVNEEHVASEVIEDPSEIIDESKEDNLGDAENAKVNQKIKLDDLAIDPLIKELEESIKTPEPEEGTKNKKVENKLANEDNENILNKATVLDKTTTEATVIKLPPPSDKMGSHDNKKVKEKEVANDVRDQPEKCENSNDSANNQENEEDLLDISIIRDADEDDACAIATAIADSSAMAENDKEAHSSDRSDNDDQDEEQSERTEIENEDSEDAVDKDENEAMDFEDASNECDQDNTASVQTSDIENKENDDVEKESIDFEKDSEDVEMKEKSADGSVVKDKNLDVNEREVDELSAKTQDKILTDAEASSKDKENNAKDATSETAAVIVPDKPKVNKRASTSDLEDENKRKKPKLSNSTAEKPEKIILALPKNDKVKTLSSFCAFMQNRKMKTQLTRSDLEQFCIQKICESVMLKSNEGELHQTIKKQERTIETLRKDLQQLTKQAKDLEIVNKKLMSELRQQNINKKPLVPLKITRSVGLQVRLNVGNENTNRRRQAGTVVTPQRQAITPSNVNNARTRTVPQTNTTVVRQVAASPQKTSQQATTTTTTTTTAATTPLLSQALQTQAQAQNRRVVTPVVAKRTTTTPIRSKPEATNKPSNPGVIDLTDEDDKGAKKTGANQATNSATPVKILNKTLTPTSTTKTITLNKVIANKVTQGKPIQTKTVTVGAKTGTPTRTVTALPQSVRLTPGQVKNGSIAIPAISSSSGAPQLMYVLPTITSSAGGTQKVAFVNLQPTNGVLSSALSSVLPNKQGNTVTLKTVSNIRKHPAPLPTPPRVNVDNSLKPILPKPHLTIRKTDNGIILQWKMPYNLDLYENIASYQLYAYQETSAPPSTDMWRKVGDVKALALPMACTLTQFADKNKYYFAVRSVDVHKRIGAFSDPEEISL